MKKEQHKEPSLFDALDDEQPADDVEEELEDWVEVSQAVYMTWSHAMQLHYCWRRDLDSAVRSTNDEDASFFLQRAAGYKARVDEELK